MAPQKAGRYELLEEVGRGAMGVVYRSRDPLIGRTVAIKTLRLDDVKQGKDDPEVLERFQNEIRAAGRLTHPNIVVIHDAGVDAEGGLFYITMEFVQGRSLARMIEEKQAFPVPRVLRIMEQACRALDYAHRSHIVHRDIKPANLLMGELDTVKLTDFGTAKILERGGTQSGQIVGTPSYMAPEQVKGRPVDGRADVFALAVILYELLTGERPFPGKNVTTVIYKIVHEEPLAPIQLDSSIHPGLNAVILRGLSKDPADRYASCGDFLNALRTYRESPASTAQTVIRRVSVLPQTRPMIAGQTVPAPREPGAQPESPSQFSTASPSVMPSSTQSTAKSAVPAPEPPRAEPKPAVPPPATAAPAPAIPRIVIPEPPKRQSRAGLWVLLLVLVAAGGAAAYLYPDRIQDAWHRAESAAGMSAPASTAAPMASARRADASGKIPAGSTSTAIPAPALDSAKPAVPPNGTNPSAAAPQPAETPAAPEPVHAPSGGATKTWATAGKGALDVLTDSPGAAVSLTDSSGQAIGDCRTPCRFGDLSPGKYSVAVKIPGYPTTSRKVAVREGRIVEERLHEARGKNAAMGTLEVLSVPVGADILINGESTGRHTPSTIELPAGNYNVTLYLKGYAPFQQSVTIQQSRTAQLQAMLAHR